MIQELQFTLIACKPTCKIIDVWHNWLALYQGQSTVIWSFDTWADGDMRVWHYNEGFYMERKQDLIISWRYASLTMNRGAIKQGFTVYKCQICLYNKTHVKIKTEFFIYCSKTSIHRRLKGCVGTIWTCTNLFSGKELFIFQRFHAEFTLLWAASTLFEL